MPDIIFMDLNKDERELLLDSLGFDIDGNGIIIEKCTNKPYMCPITGKEVHFDNASILPGSTVVINTSAYTLSEYFSKYLERRE